MGIVEYKSFSERGKGQRTMHNCKYEPNYSIYSMILYMYVYSETLLKEYIKYITWYMGANRSAVNILLSILGK